MSVLKSGLKSCVCFCFGPCVLDLMSTLNRESFIASSEASYRIYMISERRCSPTTVLGGINALAWLTVLHACEVKMDLCLQIRRGSNYDNRSFFILRINRCLFVFSGKKRTWEKWPKVEGISKVLVQLKVLYFSCWFMVICCISKNNRARRLQFRDIFIVLVALFMAYIYISTNTAKA